MSSEPPTSHHRHQPPDGTARNLPVRRRRNTAAAHVQSPQQTLICVMRAAIFTPHLLPGNSSPADLTAHAADEAPAAVRASVWKIGTKRYHSPCCLIFFFPPPFMILLLSEINLIADYFWLKRGKSSGFSSRTHWPKESRGAPTSPALSLLHNTLPESGRGSELTKELGAVRNSSDPVLTARHLVADNEASSQEIVSLRSLFHPHCESAGRLWTEQIWWSRELTVIHVDVSAAEDLALKLRPWYKMNEVAPLWGSGDKKWVCFHSVVQDEQRIYLFFDFNCQWEKRLNILSDYVWFLINVFNVIVTSIIVQSALSHTW